MTYEHIPFLVTVTLLEGMAFAQQYSNKLRNKHTHTKETLQGAEQVLARVRRGGPEEDEGQYLPSDMDVEWLCAEIERLEQLLLASFATGEERLAAEQVLLELQREFPSGKI